MNTKCDPEDLAKALLSRSCCNVQVSAVLSDNRGIFAWGWNNDGGVKLMGECAERHAIRRANRQRLRGARLVVSAKRAKSGSQLLALPCGYHEDGAHSEGCFQLALDKGISKIKFTLKKEGWGEIDLDIMRVHPSR